MNFKIKKGKHYHSNWWLRLGALLFSKTINRKIRFDSTCWYPYMNKDSKDLNKLLGMSYLYDPHYTSGRLTWLPDFDMYGYIDIYTYVYEQGLKPYQKMGIKPIKICSVRTRSWVNVSITREKDRYVFKVGNHTKVVACERPKGSIKLYPYFGGNNSAPHNMNIEIKR